MEDSSSQRKSPACSENILSWTEVLEVGNEVPDTVLTDIEKSQAVNQACMLIQTSGTTGPPKGNPNHFTKSCTGQQNNFFSIYYWIVFTFLIPI